MNFKQVNSNIYTALSIPERAKYDFRAAYYEWLVGTKWFNKICWNTLPSSYTEFAGEAILQKSGRLIDIGCGGLSQTASLYRLTGNNCVLFDRSIGMLKVAEKRLQDKGKKIPDHIKIIQGDAFDLPFPESCFDILCSFGTLHLFDNKQGFIERILKVLKPGGHFYFSVMTGNYMNSRVFMNFLRLFGEFGKVCPEKEILSLFSSDRYRVESYMKGSVLFIRGKKINFKY